MEEKKESVVKRKVQAMKDDQTQVKSVNVTVVDCKKLNIRESPDFGSEIIGLLDVGAIIMVESISNGWARIYTSAGVKGYVMNKFLKEI